MRIEAPAHTFLILLKAILCQVGLTCSEEFVVEEDAVSGKGKEVGETDPVQYIQYLYPCSLAI